MAHTLFQAMAARLPRRQAQALIMFFPETPGMTGNDSATRGETSWE
jgi:hypothetical protein